MSSLRCVAFLVQSFWLCPDCSDGPFTARKDALSHAADKHAVKGKSEMRAYCKAMNSARRPGIRKLNRSTFVRLLAENTGDVNALASALARAVYAQIEA